MSLFVKSIQESRERNKRGSNQVRIIKENLKKPKQNQNPTSKFRFNTFTDHAFSTSVREVVFTTKHITYSKIRLEIAFGSRAASSEPRNFSLEFKLISSNLASCRSKRLFNT